MVLILLLFIPLLSHSVTAEPLTQFGPINRTPDEAITGFSAKHLEQFADKAPVLFSQFMAGISSQFEKTSQYHTNIASAQFYFNDLYANSSLETKKSLSALTTKLDKLMKKEYWSTEKKALLIHAFLQSAFSELLKTLHSKQDKEKAQKLSRNLIISLTPTLLGMRDKLKRLPWKRIVALSALAGGGLYAYKNNLWQHFKNNTSNTFKILSHINDSVAENQRIKDAFNETIEQDSSGKLRVRHNHATGRPEYLVKESYRTNSDKKTEQWIPAPEGFGDRALRLGEELKPLVSRVVDNMSESANQQRAWFIAHKIPTDNPHEHFKKVEVEPGIYEMRYASSVMIPQEKVPTTATALKRFMVNHKLWRDEKTGRLHPTVLPPRNLMEQTVTAATGLVSVLQDKTVKGFIGTLDSELKRNRNDALNWLKSEGLVAKDATDPTALLPGVSVHWDTKDNRIYYLKRDVSTGAAEIDPAYPPASVIDKLFLGISSVTAPGSTSEKLLQIITSALANSQQDMRQWLYNEGLSVSREDATLKPGVGYYSDENHMEYYLRDKNQEWGAMIQCPVLLPDGTQEMVNSKPAFKAKKNQVYPPLSGASHLFTTLSKISREGGIPLEQLMTLVKNEMQGVKEWGELALSGVTGSIKHGLSIKPFLSSASKAGASRQKATEVRNLIAKIREKGDKALAEKEEEVMNKNIRGSNLAALDKQVERLIPIAHAPQVE
ncbi:MAG: hypothetical protein QG632_27 [Candidatus Dependentiae bacterium]|nr:hypothetical protein [Candidatus Dependentiae bacterium]